MVKQARIFYLTFFLIVATSTLFFAFDCPYLVDRVHVLIPVVSGLTFVFTLSNLFKTSFSDPGTVQSVQSAYEHLKACIRNFSTNRHNSPGDTRRGLGH